MSELIEAFQGKKVYLGLLASAGMASFSFYQGRIDLHAFLGALCVIGVAAAKKAGDNRAEEILLDIAYLLDQKGAATKTADDPANTPETPKA